MSGFFVLCLLLACVYAFLAMAPSEIVQLILASSWVLLAVSVIIFPIMALLR
jgi:hypothetical protein